MRPALWGNPLTMKKSLTVIAGFVLMGMAAQAHLIDVGYELLPTQDPKDTLPELQDLTGLDLVYLAKNNRGSTTENGAISYASHFTVSYSSDGTSATLTWNLNDVPYDLRYVVIKDGIPQGGGDKYYHLYSVTSDQYKVDDQGASVVFNVADEPTAGETQRTISHISFYGVKSQVVPDGGPTLALLGVGILSLGALARRRK
jgi:hypothetical protein